MITSATPEWRLTPITTNTPKDSLAAFISGEGPFSASTFVPLRRMYGMLDRVTGLMAKEVASVIAMLRFPMMARVPMSGKASLHVLKHTFDVAAEQRHFEDSAHSFVTDAASFADIESDCTSLIANVLPMGYITQHTLEGLAKGFDATESGHEILATSAQRMKALTDELTLSMNRGLFVAVLYGITGNTEG